MKIFIIVSQYTGIVDFTAELDLGCPAQMKALATVLSIFSLMVSGLFCWLGFSCLKGAPDDFLVLFMGTIALLYGISSAAFLVGACSPKSKLLLLSKWSAAFILVLWSVGLLDSGMVSDLELVSIFYVAFVLMLNVVSVRCVLHMRSTAQPRSIE